MQKMKRHIRHITVDSCRQLKNEAGIKGQMLLNYDMTFLLILLTGLYELEHEEISYRCAVASGGKKDSLYQCGDGICGSHGYRAQLSQSAG